MTTFKFRRDVSYSEYFKVEAETADEALDILRTCDATDLFEKYEDGESDSLTSEFELDEEGDDERDD